MLYGLYIKSPHTTQTLTLLFYEILCYIILVYWALEYHTLTLFFLKEPLWNKSLYLLLPGYLKAQCKSADVFCGSQWEQDWPCSMRCEDKETAPSLNWLGGLGVKGMFLCLKILCYLTFYCVISHRMGSVRVSYGFEQSVLFFRVRAILLPTIVMCITRTHTHLCCMCRCIFVCVRTYFFVNL